MFSHGGWSWNEPDGVHLLLAFLNSKDVSSLLGAARHWHEGDGVDLLLAFMALQLVSTLMVAGAGIKLMVVICCWHSWLHSK
jgi:hypothetical protein